MYPLIEDVQGRMVNHITEEIKTKKPFEARELCAKFTTDVVSNAIFGVDARSFTEEKPEIREMGRRLLAPSGIIMFMLMVASVMPALKKFISLKFTDVEVDNFLVNLMDQALTYRKKNNVQREDFLDYLIQLRKKKGMEKIDMAAHTISFFIDGFETSSIAIALVLYEVNES